MSVTNEMKAIEDYFLVVMFGLRQCLCEKSLCLSNRNPESDRIVMISSFEQLLTDKNSIVNIIKSSRQISRTVHSLSKKGNTQYPSTVFCQIC